MGQQRFVDDPSKYATLNSAYVLCLFIFPQSDNLAIDEGTSAICTK
jgi:hypothetical protein